MSGAAWVNSVHALLDEFPTSDLHGRLVNQDLPQTLAQATTVAGVEYMAHNFFEEQPVKGATYYYMRNTLHDWPDEQCLVILGHLRRDLGERSSILIDDIVMPVQGAHRHATTYDMVMLAAFASRERSVDE